MKEINKISTDSGSEGISENRLRYRGRYYDLYTDQYHFQDGSGCPISGMQAHEEVQYWGHLDGRI